MITILVREGRYGENKIARTKIDVQVGSDLGVLRTDEQDDKENPESQGAHRAHIKLQKRGQTIRSRLVLPV